MVTFEAEILKMLDEIIDVYEDNTGKYSDREKMLSGMVREQHRYLKLNGRL